MDDIEEEATAHNIKEQLFHTTVRVQTENYFAISILTNNPCFHLQIFLLLCILLYSGSYALIRRFRRSDHEDLYSPDEDEVTVYRIRWEWT